MTAGSVFDYSKTPGSNTTIAGINIAPGCPSSSVGPALRQHLADIAEAVVHSIVAGGTADALTVTFTNIPAALTDGMELKVRATAANATTTPTLTTNTTGDTGHTITKLGGAALVATDIAGALHELTLRYNLANTRWELLNPKVAGGVTSIADATNGGLNFSAASGTATANLKPADLVTKATPTTADSILIMDAANANVATTATIPKVMAALFSPITNSLASDISLTNATTYFDGPGVAQGATGTWFVSGTVTITGNANDVFRIKLWDGATVIASATTQSAVGVAAVIALSGFLASPAGNLRISVKNATSTTGSLIQHGDPDNGKNSTITAFRIA